MAHKMFLALYILAVSTMGLPSASAQASAFSDVPERHASARAIRFLAGQDIVQGYPDGTFRPDATINRAEFTKIVMGALLGKDALKGCLERYSMPFSDVPVDVWFAQPVCRAHQRRIVQGYPDPSDPSGDAALFRPDRTINVAEAAKIIVEAFELPVGEDATLWYRPFIVTLADHGALPTSLPSVDAALTRGQMAELIWRVKEKMTAELSLSADQLLYKNCVPSQQSSIPGVDFDRVRKTWLAWVNIERARAGLEPYELDPQLSRTAALWSHRFIGQSSMSHLREGQSTSSEYDFSAVESWFEDQGIVFANRDRRTFTENIGWGRYSCEQADCTQQLIDAIRFSFDLYLSEKDQVDQPHYGAIMSQYFQRMGLGIAVDPAHTRYYLTVHYGTWLVEKPEGEICR